MNPDSSTASPVLSRRSSGILLHPSSLPGPWGIGDLGPEANAFVDFLHATGQRLWEVLPLGPTGYGDSPYQSLSAFAGNPNLVSPERLVEDGLLSPEDLAGIEPFPEGVVDFGAVIPLKRHLLQRAFERFRAGARPELIEPLRDFRAEHQVWLEDFALFAALKNAHDGVQWLAWEEELACRDARALERAREDLKEEIEYQVFAQFVFFRQWLSLKRYANQRDVQIVGDIPIFVGHDSADVWVHQDIFYLDETGRMTAVAGAPPDFHISTGQLWGNPLYRWDVLKERGYEWWVERFRMALTQADVLRLDHFRGFANFWEVAADAESAAGGKWAPGPGADLFEVAARELGPLPLVAEDLGLITPDVHALRQQLGYPGMKVLIEAFYGNADNPYLPHNYTHDFMVYPGTHDMQTVRGWWAVAPPAVKDNARIYMGVDGHDVAWDFIRLALASVADMAVIQMQDLLDLDNSARMNTPGTTMGNWTWRYRREQLDHVVAERLRTLTRIYGRSMPPPTEATEPMPGRP
ncbi:MAG TPA: 4-alpha-glucanotransferase [Chloroflexia bacterium]|nr:4-alpha-glucanotransferase [Chloroflexia bacterium]